MAAENILTKTKGSDWDQAANHGVSDDNNPSTGAIAALLSETNSRLGFSKATGVLDNGCGPGGVMSALLSQYGCDLPAQCTLTCSDFSSGMIDHVDSIKASKSKAGEQRWSQVNTMVSNAMDMSAINSETQSHVLAGWVYFMTPDPQACLAESKRMLKIDGVLGLTSWHDSQWMEIMRQLKVVFPERAIPDIPDKWSSIEAVKNEMEVAGFSDVVSKPITVYMGYETHEKLVRTLLSVVPPMVAAVKGLSEDELERVVTVMVRRAREFNPEEPGRLSGEAIVAVGSK